MTFFPVEWLLLYVSSLNNRVSNYTAITKINYRFNTCKNKTGKSFEQKTLEKFFFTRPVSKIPVLFQLTVSTGSPCITIISQLLLG